MARLPARPSRTEDKIDHGREGERTSGARPRYPNNPRLRLQTWCPRPLMMWNLSVLPRMGIRVRSRRRTRTRPTRNRRRSWESVLGIEISRLLHRTHRSRLGLLDRCDVLRDGWMSILRSLRVRGMLETLLRLGRLLPAVALDV